MKAPWIKTPSAGSASTCVEEQLHASTIVSFQGFIQGQIQDQMCYELELIYYIHMNIGYITSFPPTVVFTNSASDQPSGG